MKFAVLAGEGLREPLFVWEWAYCICPYAEIVLHLWRVLAVEATDGGEVYFSTVGGLHGGSPPRLKNYL